MAQNLLTKYRVPNKPNPLNKHKFYSTISQSFQATKLHIYLFKTTAVIYTTRIMYKYIFVVIFMLSLIVQITCR